MILRRNEPQHRLELIGGHVNWLECADREESHIECCVRELKGELSLPENVSWSRSKIDQQLSDSLEEIGQHYNRSKSIHRNSAEHVRIFKLSWPNEWGDPALPWWTWNEEVVSGYWVSMSVLFKQNLTSEMVNTSLRMFIERKVVAETNS